MRKSFKTLSELKFKSFQKEAWKRKLWLYKLEKEPYFPYGKRAQIGKVSKLLLILILTHGTAIWIFI